MPDHAWRGAADNSRPFLPRNTAQQQRAPGNNHTLLGGHAAADAVDGFMLLVL